MYGQDILCGISKGTFEIQHKISYPYMERIEFHTGLRLYKLLDLTAHCNFRNWSKSKENKKWYECQTDQLQDIDV